MTSTQPGWRSPPPSPLPRQVQMVAAAVARVAVVSRAQRTRKSMLATGAFAQWQAVPALGLRRGRPRARRNEPKHTITSYGRDVADYDETIIGDR